MDMVSFLIGFIAACVFWLFIAGAYSAGKGQSALERKQQEHQEQKERVNTHLH